jgi:hypothetical protein
MRGGARGYHLIKTLAASPFSKTTTSHDSRLAKPYPCNSPPSPPPRRCATRIPRGSTTSSAPLERGEDVFINTVRVPKYEGVARLQRRKDLHHYLETNK